MNAEDFVLCMDEFSNRNLKYEEFIQNERERLIDKLRGMMEHSSADDIIDSIDKMLKCAGYFVENRNLWIYKDEKDIPDGWPHPVEFLVLKNDTDGVYVDKCMADAVKELDSIEGFNTLFSCCGHGYNPGYIKFQTNVSNRTMKKLMPMTERISKGIYRLRFDCCQCPDEVKDEYRRRFVYENPLE